MVCSLTALVSLSGARTHPGRRRGLNGLIRVVLSNRRFYRVSFISQYDKTTVADDSVVMRRAGRALLRRVAACASGFAAMRRRYSFTAFTLRDMRAGFTGFRAQPLCDNAYPPIYSSSPASHSLPVDPTASPDKPDASRQQASTEGVCLSDDAVSHSIFVEHRRPTYAQF